MVSMFIRLCRFQPELFKDDMDFTNLSLAKLAEFATSTGQMAYYEILRFSPMELRLNFSLGGSAEDKQGQKTQFHGELPNLLLQSIGVTLTDINNASIK